MAETLWHECVTWLIRCEVLPFDHRVTQPNSQVIDLANTLRDGVLLCQLLNKLVPGCIDLKEISLRPQMSQFLCLKNIRTFLQACQNVFDIHTTDLFEPYMLFDYTNFVQVLHTLSCISKSSRAESSGIRGFLPNSRSHDYYNDDIYRNLQDIANHNACALEEENTFQLDSLRGNGRRRQAAEDVYQDLCYVTFRTSQVRSTASIPLEKRDYCIKELVETESNYIDALNMIVKHFMRPLKSVMRPEDRKVVFMHITYFAEIHTGFHSDLNKACNSAQHQISECFLHWREKFITYGDYCSNLPHAQDLVDDLCNRSEIINQAILKCQLNANDGKFKLRDLLSVPMQRVLKYHLLLKELLKHSLDTHEDYEGLEKALESMLDLSMYINEVKRDNETLQIIKDIENSITDLSMVNFQSKNTELKDYGRLLKDGEMKIRSHDDNKLKNRYIFIFDKVMLMCKSTRGEQYSYKEALILRDYKVEDVYSAKMSNRDKWSHYWYLVHRQNKTAYTMYAKTEDMKHKWIEAIERALETVMPSDFRFTDHLFAMFTFEKPTYCVECNKLLRYVCVYYLTIYCVLITTIFIIEHTLFCSQRCFLSRLSVCKFVNFIKKVRSCGAPSLPPRPSIPPPSSPSPSSISPLPSPLEETPSVRIGQDSVLCIVKAKQSYENNAPGHLHFSIGDFIIVTRKLNRVWWEGDKSNMDKTDVVKAKASHGAFKGHVTRKLNSIRHTLTGISDPAFLSDKIIINVEAQLDKLEMSLSKLEYSLNILSDIIPPVDYNTLENEFDVYTSDIDNIRTAIFNLVQAYHKVHAGLEVKSPSLNDTTTPARRFLTTLKPDDLEIDTTLSDFKRWRKQFEDYYYANQMERMNHAEQRAHLRSCMSLKVQNTVIHLLEVNDAANVVAVLDHLQIYYRAALNIMTRRLHFQQCVQKSGETFSDYLIRLRLLGDNAELDNLSYEDRLASHIVAFIHDRDLQKDLLRMDSHDFKSVKEKCLTWEASNRNQLGMNMFTNSSTAINQISTYKKNKRRIHPLRRDSKIDKHCYRCGVIFNVDHINKCPAKEAICKNCGIKGHFQKVCSRPKYGSDIPVKSHAIQVCVAKSLQERSPPTAEVFVSRSTGNSAKIKTTILPDTGATECLVADTVAKKWNIPINRSNIRKNSCC
ncbi:Protein vav [Nymphon striatum]|nr:Protein vav [Nymphon striatum]